MTDIHFGIAYFKHVVLSNKPTFSLNPEKGDVLVLYKNFNEAKKGKLLSS